MYPVVRPPQIKAVWRNSSASDSRSQGWEFESPCGHLIYIHVSTRASPWPLYHRSAHMTYGDEGT